MAHKIQTKRRRSDKSGRKADERTRDVRLVTTELEPRDLCVRTNTEQHRRGTR